MATGRDFNDTPAPRSAADFTTSTHKEGKISSEISFIVERRSAMGRVNRRRQSGSGGDGGSSSRGVVAD